PDMLNGKDPSRGMIYILFTVMIATLSINLSSALTCLKSFRTLRGGYRVVPQGRACKPRLTASAFEFCCRLVCDTGVYTHDCNFDSCSLSLPSGPSSIFFMTFQGCKKADGSGSATTVFVASFVTSTDRQTLSAQRRTFILSEKFLKLIQNNTLLQLLTLLITPRAKNLHGTIALLNNFTCLRSLVDGASFSPHQTATNVLNFKG
ncbi:hypothetical protein MJO28_000637, partial [Puccinia striiformis f. sp. tritici]